MGNKQGALRKKLNPILFFFTDYKIGGKFSFYHLDEYKKRYIIELSIMRRNRIIVILIFAALLSGIFWNLNNFGQPADGDGVYYSKIAINILENGQLSIAGYPTTQQTEPFYPVFLSGVYFLFGINNFEAVRIVQIIIFILTVLVAYSLAEKLGGKRIAVFTGILMILCYPLVESAGHLFREVIFTFFVILSAYFLYKARETEKYIWFGLAGFIFALAILTNSVIQLLPIFIIAVFILIYKRDFFSRKIWIKILFFILIMFLMLSPWIFRNYFKSGVETVGIKTGLSLHRKVIKMENITGAIYGKNLIGQLFGYYFVSDPNFDSHNILELIETNDKNIEMLNSGYTPKQIDAILTKECLLAMLKNPFKVFSMSILDFLQLNGPSFIDPLTLKVGPMQNLFAQGTHPEIPDFIKTTALIVLRLAYWILAGGVIFGLIKSLKDFNKFALILAFIVYFNLIYSFLFGLPRYAIPIYPFYILLFVIGLSSFFKKHKNLLFWRYPKNQ